MTKSAIEYGLSLVSVKDAPKLSDLNAAPSLCKCGKQIEVVRSTISCAFNERLEFWSKYGDYCLTCIKTDLLLPEED